jgi:hypothetical protein
MLARLLLKKISQKIVRFFARIAIYYWDAPLRVSKHPTRPAKTHGAALKLSATAMLSVSQLLYLKAFTKSWQTRNLNSHKNLSVLHDEYTQVICGWRSKTARRKANPI